MINEQTIYCVLGVAIQLYIAFIAYWLWSRQIQKEELLGRKKEIEDELKYLYRNHSPFSEIKDPSSPYYQWHPYALDKYISRLNRELSLINSKLGE